MSAPISSRGNPAVKRIRALRGRKEREESGLCWVEGIRIVGEAVQLGAQVETLVVAPELLASPFARELVEGARGSGTPVLEVTAAVFGSLSGRENPQGLGAVVRQRWERLEELTPGDELCWVALEGVGDPGNLGTILRTGDAVGAGGVVLLGDTADPYDPAAVRGSMGAVFSQRLVRAALPELAAWKERHRVTFVGTSDAAVNDYRTVEYERPLAVLMGSEAQGLSREAQALCDQVVSIPMVGRGDSLNLAVATAVMLYEVFTERRGTTSSG